jgi:hypothetical protein
MIGPEKISCFFFYYSPSAGDNIILFLILFLTPCFPGPNDYVVDPESKRVLEEKIKLVFPLWEEEKRPGSGFFNQTVNIVVMFISLSYYVFP